MRRRIRMRRFGRCVPGSGYEAGELTCVRSRWTCSDLVIRSGRQQVYRRLLGPSGPLRILATIGHSFVSLADWRRKSCAHASAPPDSRTLTPAVN